MAPTTPDVVLLHGITSSGRAWKPIVGELSRHFDVYTPTALGHRGGRIPQARMSLTDIVDDAERFLDLAGLDRPHLVGHSMGGYTAIELARRGRAASVLVFSPSGFWSAGDGTAALVMQAVQRSGRIARFAGPVLKAAVSSTAGRRIWMGAAVASPRSMTARQARDVVEDQAGCIAAGRLFIGDDEIVHALDPLPCPITVAWAEKDDVLPLGVYAAAVRSRLPQARFVVLPGVGHAVMVDHPGMVVRTIIELLSVADP